MKLTRIIFCLLPAILFLGCSSSSNITPVFKPNDNRYTSAYPDRNISEKLESIHHSVQRVISTVQYKVYDLHDKSLTYDNIFNSNLDSLAPKSTVASESNAGTAISILRNNKYTVFITAAHVITSPDTLYSFQENNRKGRQAVVRSVSVKKDQNIYLFDQGLLFGLETVAVDPEKDLALLFAKNKSNLTAPVLSIQTGTAKNLAWGSVIYIMGYPLGNAMVTNGIVSSPDYDKRGSFLTDALFNHGISGGIIIGSNDSYKTFEWVGMASTSSVRKQHFLIPNPLENKFYQNLDAYMDTSYVMEMNFINYGVSKTISIENILQFIYDNEKKLNKLGLSATGLPGQ